ncbi:MAG: orotate phosphoribosyltransferase [Candidatus Diapherotrites archaeon]
MIIVREYADRNGGFEMLDRHKKEIAAILLDINAVKLNFKKPYKWVSGILSPIYTDNRLLMSHTEERRKVMAYMQKLVNDKIGSERVDVVAGVATSGIPPAAWLAERMEKPLIYVRVDAKDHGLENRIEGKLDPGKRVLIVEDLISTGGSLINVVNAVRDAGGKVKNCVAIFTYQLPKAKYRFEDADVTLYTLTDFATLVQVAFEKDKINEDEKKKILEFSKDPENWASKVGIEM